jgi:hypothetical protein
LPRGLALELGHDGIVDVQGRLHMANNIVNMDIYGKTQSGLLAQPGHRSA